MRLFPFSVLVIQFTFVYNSFASTNTFPDGRLKEFTTDGCSGSPDGIYLGKHYDWTKCCIAHDVEYWIGGLESDKQNADDELKKCISKNANSLIADIYEAGVKIGGGPELPTTWRWGYGWDNGRPWRQRTPEDLEKIAELKTRNWSAEEIVNPEFTDLNRQVITCVESETSHWLFVLNLHPNKIGRGELITYPLRSAPVSRTFNAYFITSGGLYDPMPSLILQNFEPAIEIKNTNLDNSIGLSLLDYTCNTKMDNQTWPMTGLYTIENKTRKACCQILH